MRTRCAATLVTNGGGTGYCDPCYGFVEGNDHYPEFFVGRLLVHTVAEMQTLVDRTLEYEKTPYLGEEWFNIAVGIGSNEGAGIGDNNESDWQHQNAIKDQLLDYGFQEVWELYDGNQGGGSPTGGETADEAGNPNANDMVQLVNKGLSFINYTGHGYHGGIASSGFDVNAIGQTTNAGMYGFFVPVACCVGDFDEGEGSGDCFGEVWIKHTANGAPAGGIGGAFSSVLQSWAPPMRGQDEMVDLVVEEGEVEINHTFGSIVAHGCAGMIDSYGGAGEEMMDTWCIFGDPTVVMRTAFPENLALGHQDVYFLGTPSITVTSANEGALVALTFNGEILGTGFVENGTVTMELAEPISVPGDYLITGTAYNTIPYQAVVQAVPAAGPYVLSNGNTTRGHRGRRATATWTRARASTLELDLANVGVETAMDVMVTVTSDDRVGGDHRRHGIRRRHRRGGHADAGRICVRRGGRCRGPARGGLRRGDDRRRRQRVDGTSFHCWCSTRRTSPSSASRWTTVETTASSKAARRRRSPSPSSTTGTMRPPAAWASWTSSHPDVTMFNNGDYVMEDIEPGATFTQGYGVEVSADAAPGGLLAMAFTFNTFGPDEQDLYLTAGDFFEPINLIMETWESGDDETFPWAYDGSEEWFVSDQQRLRGRLLHGKRRHQRQPEHGILTIGLEFLGDGELSFARRVCSEDGWDYLRLYIDGQHGGRVVRRARLG